MAQSSGKSTVKSDSCGESDDLTVLIITTRFSVTLALYGGVLADGIRRPPRVADDGVGRPQAAPRVLSGWKS
jgi:hypothetical protein